jgi:phage terminase large subunit-like protein
MPMVAWDMCADPALDAEELAGEECVTALDLASKLDICANVNLFTKTVNGQRHYYAFGRYYLPEQTVEEAKNNQTAYRKWVRQGLLTLTEGAELDFDVVGADVLADKSRFQIREIVYDPWRATHLAHQLMKDGAEVVEFAQNRHSLIAQAADELLAAVKAGRFHHNGDPIMKWMVSNVVLKMRNGVGIPTKEKQDNKIDGAVAIIMAMARSMVPTETESEFFVL